MSGRINKIALSGWRGMPYLEVELDPGSFTALIGSPGAGKSTVAMLLCYALMPDRSQVEIKFISGVQDARRIGVDNLAGRIDPRAGYAYVLLDMQSKSGARVVAGLHVRVIDSQASFTCLHWQDVPEDLTLQDCLRVVDAEDELYPDLQELGAALAEKGVTLHECRTIREYGELLYNVGVVPCDYSDRSDRSLYAKLIESTFQGGLNQEVASKLKEYMLPAAARLPESVDRLQRCADTVLRTTASLSEAERQLRLLQDTYGLGKNIVSLAVASSFHSRNDLSESVTQAKQEIINQKETLESIQRTLASVEETLGVANTAKVTIEESFSSDLERLTNLQLTLKGDQITKAGLVTTAKGLLDQYLRGKRTWNACLGGEVVEHSFKALENRLKTRLEESARDKARAELELEAIGERIARLEAGLAAGSSASLSDALGTPSIAEHFENVTEDQARSLELVLGGVVDGVIGADISALASLKDDANFPDTFWLRGSAPQEEEPHEVGDWLVLSSAGGYLVTSKRRKLTLGSQARQKEIQTLKVASAAVEKDKLVPLEKARSDLEALQVKMHQNKGDIDFFLDPVNSEEVLRKALGTAQEANVSAERTLTECSVSLKELNAARGAKVSEAEAAIAGLADQKLRAEGKKASADSAMNEANTVVVNGTRQLAEIDEALVQMRAALGTSWDWVTEEANTLPVIPENSRIANQARWLSQLGQALNEEPPERLQWLKAAAPEDPVSLCAIWAPLREVVGDRISVENLEADGADLIAEMTQRRHGLAGKLDAERSQMRAEATSLYSSISTEIRKQERRIERLSAFGQTLSFGNVTGMRIVASHRDDLLEHLKAFAKQIDLFASNQDKPLDVHLAELFNKMLGSHYSGAELLDYRTYMELAIEARRDGEWDLASGLSGGKSIGGGLAFSLMLARSLSQRGADRNHVFTPMFVIDEVQRLDAVGQKLIVEFGKAQNFQVLVTALGLEHKYPCTMYGMARSYIPQEQVVMRRIVVTPKIA
jgi:energy-coupling factor transporter ATP-binding protein EcfA2